MSTKEHKQRTTRKRKYPRDKNVVPMILRSGKGPHTFKKQKQKCGVCGAKLVKDVCPNKCDYYQ